MSDTAAGNSRMLKDTVLYMLAKAIEGIVGIVTISKLTYLFADTETGGRYNLLNITVTTLAMLSIQWLSQSASRYLNDYELKKDSKTFYSTVFAAWFRVNITGVVVSVIFGWFLLSIGEANAPAFLEFFYGDDFGIVFALTITYFVTYNTSQMLIALLSVKRKVYINLIISVFSSVGKLALILVFSGVFGAHIWIVFLSYIICDFFAIVLALAILKALMHIKQGGKSKELMREFGRYGAPLVGNLATTTVLNNSDRYIIQQYFGKSQVGVYTMNYSVVSAVFTMLQTALMRGSYPTILKTYVEGNKELTERLVSHAVRNYLLVAIPAVVGVGALAEPLAELLFSPAYRSGYRVMVWVALGMLFLGLTEYSNKPWELSARTWYIFRNSAIGGIVNLTLNIVFMPLFGYMVAAYSTLIGFLVYFCLSKLGSRRLMRWRLPVKTYASIIGSALVMGVCIFTSIRLLGVTRFTMFLYVIAGVFIYGLSISLTGEIKEEMQMAKSFLKNRAKNN